MIGATAGTSFHVAAAAFGLATLVNRWPEALTPIRGAGACFLLVAAVKSLSGREATRVAPPSLERLGEDALHAGIRAGLRRPILFPFFFAYLSQFIDPDALPPEYQSLLLAGVLTATLLTVFTAYALLAALFSETVLKRSGRAAPAQRRISLLFHLLGFRAASPGK